jgi:RsiW-degrading membrane proteinase PrsW (M82 family)
MSEPASSPKSPESAQPIHALVERTAKEVRKNPVKSVVWSFFVGLLLTIFPIGRILGAVVSLLLMLLRPVLLILGAMKLVEEVEQRRRK